MASQSSAVQLVLDHVHQFKLALLFDWQDIDEGLVKHGSSWQLGDDLEGLKAAWWWDIDLLGESDVAVLQSKERVVVSYPHVSSWVIPHQPLGCKDVTRMDKVTILFLEAISPASTLSSVVLTAPTSLLRCKPNGV